MTRSPKKFTGQFMAQLNKISGHNIFIPYVIMFLFGSVLLIHSPISAAENTSIYLELFKHVEIENDTILLGDIANVEGGDTLTINKIKDIFIGKSPLPGKSRRIDKHYVNLRLKQNGFDTKNVKVHGPVEVEIIRGFNRITKEEIKKIVLDAVPELISHKKDQINITDVKVNGDVILPKGKYTFSVDPPKHTDFIGKVPLTVSFYINGQYQKRASVTVDLELIAEVVVAARPIRRNHRLSNIDIKVVKMNLADAPSNCIKDPEDILGKRIKRAISTNTILRSDLINLPPVINRNDVVMLVAESKYFKITAVGESKGSGNKGDRIKVVNLDSKNEVYGRIIDSNSVKVDF